MRKVPNSRASECLTQKYIGSSYDNVKIVADNIAAVKMAADNMNNIVNIFPYVGDISAVATVVNEIKDAPAYAKTAKDSADIATAAETEVVKARDEVVQAKQDVDTAKASVDASQQDVTTKATQVSQDAATVATSLKTVTDAEKVVTDTQADVSRIANTISQDAAQVAADKQAVATDKQDVDTKASEVSTAKTSVDGSLATIQGIQTDVTTKATQVRLDATQVTNDAATVASNTVQSTKDAQTATTEAAKAVKAAQDALANANLTFVSGGLFTPTVGTPYPDITGISRDTIWIAAFPNANDSFTYTTGQLNGKAIKNGDMLFLDAPANTFDIVQMSGSGGGIISVNGKTGTNVTLNSDDVGALGKTAKAADSALLDGVAADVDETPNTIVKRDGNGDIEVHSAKFTAGRNVGTVPSWATIPFRGNTTNDSALRFANMTDFKAWLDYTPTNIGAVSLTDDEAISGVKDFKDDIKALKNIDLYSAGNEQTVRRNGGGESHGIYFNSIAVGIYDWANTKTIATYVLNGGALHYFDGFLRTETHNAGLNISRSDSANEVQLNMFNQNNGIRIAMDSNGAYNLWQGDKSGGNVKRWMAAYKNAGVDLMYNNAVKFSITSYGANVTSQGLTQLVVHNTSDTEPAEVHARNNNAGLVLRQAADAGYLIATDANGQNAHTTVRAVRGGATELWYNNVKRFETTSFGAQTTGNHLVDGQQISLANNQNTGAFLEIKSSNPNIDRGIKLIQHQNKTGYLQSSNGAGTSLYSMISWSHAGGVSLHFANNVRLTTTVDGVAVTGQGVFTRNGDAVTLKGTANGNSATPLLRYKQGDGRDIGYIGYGSGSNSHLYIENAVGNVNIHGQAVSITDPHSNSPQGTDANSLTRKDYVDSLLGSRTVFEGDGPNITLKSDKSGRSAVPHMDLVDASDRKLGSMGCIISATDDVALRAFEGNVLIQPSDSGYTYITKPRMYGQQEDNFAALTRKSYVDDLSAVRTVFSGNATNGQDVTLSTGLSNLREITVTVRSTYTPSTTNYVFSGTFDADVLAVDDVVLIANINEGTAEAMILWLNIKSDTSLSLSATPGASWSAPALVKIGAYIK
ncbi:hypothetical protein pVco5_122 [Vibrio phage pVco-5]|uniref:Tail fiber protein n=1 Tax=Vibrio phage pVco-5 TaxID=1965485 RepID=A0A1W6JV14_9CAUD|nr:tail protein [Vibrio phage pVco-5]ARM71111.1 hypothetical protein pVco5_122 [Vibrio phage pVco-5]